MEPRKESKVADNPNGTSTQGESGKPDPTLEKLTGLIQGLEAKIGKMESNLNSGLQGQRSLYDRQIGQLRQMLDRATAARSAYEDGSGGGQATSQTGQRTVDPHFERLRMRQELTDFKLDHGTAYAKVKEAVDAIINNEARLQDVIVYNEEGLIDYRKTYRAALREAQLAESEKAQAAAQAAQAEADEKKKSAKAAATISGDGADEIEGGVTLDDIENMSDEEGADFILKSGLLGAPSPKRVAPVGVTRT